MRPVKAYCDALAHQVAVCRTESVVAKLAGPLVMLIAAAAGILVSVSPSVSPAFIAAADSFLLAIGGIGSVLLRIGRRGGLYARMSTLESGERRLLAVLAIPTFLSAGLFVLSTSDPDLLLPVEAGVIATGVLRASVSLRKGSDM